MKKESRAMDDKAIKTQEYLVGVFDGIRPEERTARTLLIDGDETPAEILEFRLGSYPLNLVSIPDEQARKATPAQLRKIVEHASNESGRPTAVVLPSLVPYKRNRLVNMGVSFVVPGEQMFLLPLGIDFRDYLGPNSGSDGSIFSITAQLIVMHHLLVESLEGISMSRIAYTIGYSVPTASAAVKELVDFEICETRVQGRSIFFEFTEKGRALWDRCLPHMRSPVKSEKMISKPELNRVHVQALAGIRALADYGFDVEDSPPTFVSVIKRRGRYRDLWPGAAPQPPECERALVQRWVYNPLLLLKNPERECLRNVDPLSLYLSLKDVEVEGIDDLADRLIDKVEWRGDM